MNYLGKYCQIGNFALDCSFHHIEYFCKALLDFVVLLVGLEAGSVLIFGELMLVENSILPSFIDFGELGSKDNLEVFFGLSSLQLDIYCFSVVETSCEDLILDLLHHLDGPFHRQCPRTRLLSTAQVLDDDVRQSQSSPEDQILDQVLVLLHIKHN